MTLGELGDISMKSPLFISLDLALSTWSLVRRDGMYDFVLLINTHIYIYIAEGVAERSNRYPRSQLDKRVLLFQSPIPSRRDTENIT